MRRSRYSWEQKKSNYSWGHCLAKRTVSPSSFRSPYFKSVVWIMCFTILSRHKDIYRSSIQKRNFDFLVNIFCPHNYFATVMVAVWSLIVTHKAGVASEPEVWYLIGNGDTNINITAAFNLKSFTRVGWRWFYLLFQDFRKSFRPKYWFCKDTELTRSSLISGCAQVYQL